MSGKVNYEIHLRMFSSTGEEFWAVVERNEFPEKKNHNDILNYVLQCNFPAAPKCRNFKKITSPVFGQVRHEGTRVVAFEIADPEFKVKQ